MTTGMIFLISLGTYILGTMITARILHIVNTRHWMRWKNEAPDQQHNFYHEGAYGGGGSFTVSRKNVSLSDFTSRSDALIGKELIPRGCAFGWMFFAPIWAISKFCFPDVKLPDQAKIQELEKL